MKVKNYENKTITNLLLVLLILIEIIITGILFTKKIYLYEPISGVVIKDDLIVLIINDNTKKILNKNNSFYLNNKKIKYKVVEDRGYIFKRNKEKYSEILISFKFDKKYKVNDSLQLMFKKEKIRLIEIFKIIWEGD